VGTGVDLVKQWGELIEAGLSSIEGIVPSEGDVKDLIEELKGLSMELGHISFVDLVGETES
jgi:hypothetical protein